MVIIGGMRSLLGPALGALFYILFREYLSIWTPNWLLFFGLLFVGFIVFSPTGLVGVWRRLTAPLRARGGRSGGDGGTHDRAATPMPAFLRRERKGDGTLFAAQGLAKSLRRHPRGRGREHRGGGPHAARADRAERRRQDDGLQSDLRPLRARPRARGSRGPGPHRAAAAPDRRGGACALVPDHEPLPVALDRGEPAARRAGGRREPLQRLDARELGRSRRREDRRARSLSGAHRHRARRSRRALLRRATASRHGAGARVRAAAPAARRAARGTGRGGARAREPARQADFGRNRGAPRRARHRPRVRARRSRDGDERRPGAGRRHGRGCARQPRGAGDLHRHGHRGARGERARPRTRRHRSGAADGRPRADLLRQEPHPARGIARRPRAGDRRAPRPQRRRQIDAAEDDHRHRARERGPDRAREATICTIFPRPRSPGSASATCRRAGVSLPG